MVGPQTFSKATCRAASEPRPRTRDPEGENLGATALKIAVVVMWVGALEFDLLLGEVHSLKEKRSVVRPLIAEVRKRFELSVAEVDHLNLHRRAGVGVAAVSQDGRGLSHSEITEGARLSGPSLRTRPQTSGRSGESGSVSPHKSTAGASASEPGLSQTEH